MTTNPMRAAVATALALTFGAAAADPEPRECSLATLVGRYVFTANGFSAATGTWQPKAIVEIIQFNGDGTLSVPAVTVANALGNGLIEATLLRRIETVRIPQEQSAAFISKMEQRIARALRALDGQVGTMEIASDHVRADQITVACALGYVDFRFTDGWRGDHLALAQWYAEIAARDSMVASVPTRATPVARERFRRA